VQVDCQLLHPQKQKVCSKSVQEDSRMSVVCCLESEFSPNDQGSDSQATVKFNLTNHTAPTLCQNDLGTF